MKLFLPAMICCSGIVASSFIFSIAQERSLRFYGNGYHAPDNDRVKIPLTAETGINIGDDFTIECWLKCVASENNGTVFPVNNGDGWITGNIFIDRDVYGSSETGDFGLSIGSSPAVPNGFRVVAFGINRLNTGLTIRGNTNVADNNWHHVAVTRNGSSGEISIYIDGQLDAAGIGPAGPVQYNIGRSTSYPNTDPFIVLGAEKHDAGSAYPSYNGFMDELRISTVLRYTGAFQPATDPFSPDSITAGLYHFNEGRGTVISDEAGNNKAPSNGELHTGGSPIGPVRINESPFQDEPFQWLSLATRKENQRIVVTWNTTPGIHSSRFEIQRSADGNRYATIGHQNSIPACMADCGYSFSDTHPNEGKNYYRIMNTNLAGEITYSSVANILFTQKITPYKIWQNGNNLVVQNNSAIESLVIWNSAGKRLLEKKNIQRGTTQVPLNHSTGFTFVHISLEDGTRYTEKILIH